MATVINNPGTERVVERTNDAGVGWAVAIILLVVVLIGIFVWPGYHRFNAPAAVPVQQAPGANINVTLPAGGGNTSGNSGGSSAPAAGSTGGSGTTQ